MIYCCLMDTFLWLCRFTFNIFSYKITWHWNTARACALLFVERVSHYYRLFRIWDVCVSATSRNISHALSVSFLKGLLLLKHIFICIYIVLYLYAMKECFFLCCAHAHSHVFLIIIEPSDMLDGDKMDIVWGVYKFKGIYACIWKACSLSLSMHLILPSSYCNKIQFHTWLKYICSLVHTHIYIHLLTEAIINKLVSQIDKYSKKH